MIYLCVVSLAPVYFLLNKYTGISFSSMGNAVLIVTSDVAKYITSVWHAFELAIINSFYKYTLIFNRVPGHFYYHLVNFGLP